MVAVASTITMILQSSIIFLLPALGELYSQRGGILNISLEGLMLTGALVSVAVAVTTSNVWLGIIGGMAAAGLLGFFHGFLSISCKVSQVASGLGIWLFAIGFTTYLGKPFEGPVRFTIPKIAFGLTPIFFIAIALVPVFWFILNRTSFGIGVRSAGEDPLIAEAWGVNVTKVRYVGVIVGGLLAGLAGAYLSLSYTSLWSPGITGGRGWIALALIFFSLWSSRILIFSSLFYGVLWVATFKLQLSLPGINVAILQALPFVVVIIALTVIKLGRFGMEQAMPASLGEPFIKE